MSLRWYLKRPHSCSYCQETNGVTFTKPGVVPRLVWMFCEVCKRRHYVCLNCLKVIGNNGDVTVKECAKRFLRRRKLVDLMKTFEAWPYEYAWVFTPEGATLYHRPGMQMTKVPARSLVLAAEGVAVGQADGFPKGLDSKSFHALMEDFKAKSKQSPMAEWWSEAIRPVATEDGPDDVASEEGGFLG